MQIADKLQLIATKEIPEVHYDLDHKGKQATLTELGLKAAYLKLGRPSLSTHSLDSRPENNSISSVFRMLVSCIQRHCVAHPVLSCPVLSCPFLFFVLGGITLGCGASSGDSSDRQTVCNMACGKLLLLLHCGQHLWVGLVLKERRHTNWEAGRQNTASVKCFWSVSMWAIPFGSSGIGNQYRRSMHGKWAGLPFLLMVSCLCLLMQPDYFSSRVWTLGLNPGGSLAPTLNPSMKGKKQACGNSMNHVPVGCWGSYIFNIYI